MSIARLKPFYVSLGVRHNGLDSKQEDDYDAEVTTDSFIRCTVNEVYRAPIVDKASDFIAAIERMELSTNAIPFYDSTPILTGGILGYERIYVVSRTPPYNSEYINVTDNAYSLSHLFELLNEYEFKDPNTGNEFFVSFSIDKDGFIIMTLLNNFFDNLYFEFPRRLNQILGISPSQQLVGSDQCISALPRIDLGDDLDHIIIQTNLPTFSDSIGNAKLNVLTDFAPPTSYSNSLTYNFEGGLDEASFSTNIRQKLIYNPNERRYLELIGDFPINEISVQVFYQNTDNQIKPVNLTYGGSFEIKIGFYLKQ